jgi:hypothetical protein
MLPTYLELAFQLFRMCTAYVDDVRRLMQSEHRELLYLRQAPWALFKLRSDRPCWGKSIRSRKIRVVVAIRGWMSPAPIEWALSKQSEARWSISSPHFADAAASSTCTPRQDQQEITVTELVL